MSVIAAAWRRNGGTRCAGVLRGMIFGEEESGWACPWEGRRGRRRHSGAAAAAALNEGRGAEMWGLKDYLDYRRSLYGGVLTHKALMVDAVGTLVVPSQPMAQIYREIGEKYGVEYSEEEILNRYRRAYEQPWGRSRLRYVNDGRPFWKFIVSSSTGCSNSQYFEELYDYYMTDKAWHLCDPEAEKVFAALRKAGVKLAVVSNFDTRLRPVLQALNCDHWFDAVAVSAEVEAEKPNPTLFLKACELLDVNPEDAVHVGDDRRNDIWCARDAGCDAWLWGSEVCSFKEVANRIGVQISKEKFPTELKARLCPFCTVLFPVFRFSENVIAGKSPIWRLGMIHFLGWNHVESAKAIEGVIEMSSPSSWSCSALSPNVILVNKQRLLTDLMICDAKENVKK